MPIKTIMKRYTAHGRKPRTPFEALTQARALLAEEGRFIKSDYFRDGDAQTVYENGSLCGKWGVCSMGALGLVTGELPIEVECRIMGNEARYYQFTSDDAYFNEDGLSARAALYLADVFQPDWDAGDAWGHRRTAGNAMNVVTDSNDSHTRKTVLAAFDKAIKLAKGKRQ